MPLAVRCYKCRDDFPLDLEALHPYRDGLIQGQRVPRYWLGCPVCGQKNVIELSEDSELVVGKPAAR